MLLFQASLRKWQNAHNDISHVRTQEELASSTLELNTHKTRFANLEQELRNARGPTQCPLSQYLRAWSKPDCLRPSTGCSILKSLFRSRFSPTWLSFWTTIHCLVNLLP
jgi:hypothetical protein